MNDTNLLVAFIYALALGYSLKAMRDSNKNYKDAKKQLDQLKNNK